MAFISKTIITRLREESGKHQSYIIGEVCRVCNFNIFGLKFRRVKILKQITCPIVCESEELKEQCKQFIRSEMDDVVQYLTANNLA